MKKVIISGIIVCSLCGGVKAQSQKAVNTKDVNSNSAPVITISGPQITVFDFSSLQDGQPKVTIEAVPQLDASAGRNVTVENKSMKAQQVRENDLPQQNAKNK